ncbi:hypothetical protein ABT337_29080 [Saccharopolyspora hirsuta]|uniref:Uncharacterized protein n=1 Tax=Saccharopolyspora hirsuta TaxID=1837 RepID=A0A5M7C9I8_SACHI|nr:hypothetical protein [Saccharopolyspora hirsuta]KAA5836868.1 hypothetical protein F1721_03200 [Saccharopolyspora hirsuta]
MTDQVPASIRYKELTALATTAAQQLRKHERARAAELGEAVAASQQRKDEAEERRQQVVEDVRVRWKAAMEALWDERWMQVKGMPEPDRSAPPATPEESRRDLQDAFMDLYNALEKPRFGAGLLPRRKKSS